MTCLLTKLSFSKFRLLWQTADHEQGETIYYELNKLPATVRNVPLLVGCKNDPSRCDTKWHIDVNTEIEVDNV